MRENAEMTAKAAIAAPLQPPQKWLTNIATGTSEVATCAVGSTHAMPVQTMI